ncbi:MAG: topoisomerase DNA-binding C4 zinc finger domain-containing protein, partial [bacterium]|nr:topoisomerase DNA-binding C4 zinc finger domain-containing protein [bacterium]
LIKDTEETCPECGKALIERWGRNGKFIGCSGYPECRFTRPLEGEQVHTDKICDKCEKPMVVKSGRYGRFLACSGYPNCTNVKPFTIGIACPRDNCNGEIVERRSKRGKVFYGCSKYPDCDFATWYLPVSLKCDNCGATYQEKRYSKQMGNYLYCPNCKSKHEQNSKDN